MDIKKIEIVEGESGVLGQAEPGDYDPIATLNAYRDEVFEQLAVDFPGAELDYVFDGTDAGPRILIRPDPVTQETEDAIERVRETLGYVYERGTFWVPA